MVRVTNDQKIILEVLSVISYQRNANYQYLRRYYNPYNINIKKKKTTKVDNGVGKANSHSVLVEG